MKIIISGATIDSGIMVLGSTADGFDTLSFDTLSFFTCQSAQSAISGHNGMFDHYNDKKTSSPPLLN